MNLYIIDGPTTERVNVLQEVLSKKVYVSTEIVVESDRRYNHNE